MTGMSSGWVLQLLRLSISGPEDTDNGQLGPELCVFTQLLHHTRHLALCRSIRAGSLGSSMAKRRASNTTMCLHHHSSSWALGCRWLSAPLKGWHSIRTDREEHSMDQYRSRLKLSENFERHWSILISGEIHMHQSLVHTFSWRNSYGPMVLKVLLSFPLHWYWSMDGSSQHRGHPERIMTKTLWQLFAAMLWEKCARLHC